MDRSRRRQDEGEDAAAAPEAPHPNLPTKTQLAIHSHISELCRLGQRQAPTRGAGKEDQQQEVLGPLACLGAVERQDVVCALAALLPGTSWGEGGLGAGLFTMVVRGEEAALAVGRELDKLYDVDDWAIIDLEVGAPRPFFMPQWTGGDRTGFY